MICDTVYVNGTFVHKDAATVSVFDHGFTYGDGIFEGLQAVGGTVFMLEPHIDRLFDSARYLSIDVPLTKAEMRDAILETARRNDLRDGYLRPIVTRGAGPLGIRNMAELGRPTIVIMAQRERIESRRKAWDQGITAQIVSTRRIPPQSLDSRAKTCNYLNNIMAYLEAKAAGADTALMLDVDGYVAEAYSSNIFCVKSGTVSTPDLGHILGGITRGLLLELCRTMGIPARETRLTVLDLYTADEVFESGTMAEVRPLIKINGRTIGDGSGGPVSRRLHAELRRMMEAGRHGNPIFPKSETHR